MTQTAHTTTRHPATEPDFSGLDSAADIIRDAAKWGLLDELRNLLCDPAADKLRIARDICYELAGAENRDLAVDLFIYVTGVAGFNPLTLQDYALKHGCTPQQFLEEVGQMRKRLNLPGQSARQHLDRNRRLHAA